MVQALIKPGVVLGNDLLQHSVVMAEVEVLMRATILGIAVILCIPAACNAAGQEREASDELRLEAAQDRGTERWRGRQHWLYDQDHQPETTALAPRTQDCAEYRVRMPRAGGGSDIRRVEKCD